MGQFLPQEGVLQNGRKSLPADGNTFDSQHVAHAVDGGDGLAVQADRIHAVHGITEEQGVGSRVIIHLADVVGRVNGKAPLDVGVILTGAGVEIHNHQRAVGASHGVLTDDGVDRTVHNGDGMGRVIQQLLAEGRKQLGRTQLGENEPADVVAVGHIQDVVGLVVGDIAVVYNGDVDTAQEGVQLGEEIIAVDAGERIVRITHHVVEIVSADVHANHVLLTVLLTTV